MKENGQFKPSYIDEFDQIDKGSNDCFECGCKYIFDYSILEDPLFRFVEMFFLFYFGILTILPTIDPYFKERFFGYIIYSFVGSIVVIFVIYIVYLLSKKLIC